MAENRCPMCGKTNPEELENCQFCQARLIPLGEKPHPNLPPAEENAEADPLDWLRGLRSGTGMGKEWAGNPTGSLESNDNPETGEDPPEWIKRLRDTSGLGKPPDEPVDWLQKIASPDEATGVVEELAHFEKEDLSEPMPSQALFNENEMPPEENLEADGRIEPPVSEQSAANLSDEDWLNSLASWQPNETEEVPIDRGQGMAPVLFPNPDEHPQAFGETAPQEKEDILPIFLEGITGSQQSEGENHEVEPPEIPENDALPDWLRNFTAESTPPPSLSADEQIADWLSGAPVVHPVEFEEAPEPEPHQDVAQISTPLQEETMTDIPFPENVQEDKLDNWAFEQPVESEAGEESFAPEPEKLPDWLAGSMSSSIQKEESSVFEDTSLDWFKQELENQSDEQVILPDEENEPATLQEDLDSKELADEDAIPQKDEPDGELAYPYGETLPDWLSGFHVQENMDSDAASEDISTFQPFAEEGLSNWYSETEDEEQPVRNTDDEESGEVTQTQLPEWLQAMRPVEAAVPSNDLPDGSLVENVGPLAGLSAVLPTNDLAAYYRKPPVYSAKLKITEKQRVHTEILENMLQGGEKAPLDSSKKGGLPQRLIKTIVGLFLLVVMTLAMIFGGQSGITPLAQADRRIMAFYDLIELVPDNVPVLVAIEYQPGYSGEMHLTATNVLARLIEKNIGLALISTLPTGPAIGIDLVEKARQVVGSFDVNRSEAYKLNQRTVVLGFLPGGTAALQEFSYQPMKAVFYGQDVIRDKKPAWENPVLTNVSGLSDFGMVIVICDNFDSGRAWIEQAQPNLGGTPLAIVTSTQAGPLFAPYVASEQVSAILSGFSNGAAYSQLVQLPPSPDGAWLAYQAGTIVVLVLIVIGLLAQGVFWLFKNRKEQERDSLNGS